MIGGSSLYFPKKEKKLYITQVFKCVGIEWRKLVSHDLVNIPISVIIAVISVYVMYLHAIDFHLFSLKYNL